MTQSRHIQDLADELLSEILAFLLEEPGFRASNGNTGISRCNSYCLGEFNDHNASAYGERSELDRRTWSWYVAVRPDVESGVRGWGEKGTVSLAKILELRKGF